MISQIFITRKRTKYRKVSLHCRVAESHHVLLSQGLLQLYRTPTARRMFQQVAKNTYSIRISPEEGFPTLFQQNSISNSGTTISMNQLLSFPCSHYADTSVNCFQVVPAHVSIALSLVITNSIIKV